VDVNGTLFQLIQGSADWKTCLGDGQHYPWLRLALDKDSAYVSLTPLLPLVAPPRLGAPLDPRQRRGAAADRLGHWYWIGADGQSIYWLPQGTRQVLLLWPQAAAARPEPVGTFASVLPPLPATLTLAGLAVTSHNYLVAGSVEPAGLLIFDLTSGARPSLLLLPDTVPFTPFDIAPSADGGCWVLDRAHKAYWGLDRDFRARAQTPGPATEPSPFQPIDGTPVAVSAVPTPAAFALVTPGSIPIDIDPIAIEGLPDDSVLVLDGTAGAAPASDETTASLIYRYRFDRRLGEPLPLSGPADVKDDSSGGLKRIPLAVIAHDIAYNPDTSTLYAAERFGRQSLAFKLALQPTPSLELQSSYLPMHLFGGRALVAWSDGGTAAVSYDVVGNPAAGDRAVRWARLQTIDQQSCARDAVLETPVLDGKARDCVWDALFLDACIPPGTKVTVTSCADNDADLVAHGPFTPEPDLYLRRAGAEIPYYDPFPGRDPQPGRLGTWELLLQRARGRYLKVRLEFSGDGSASPQLKALRVYYPRFSYARQYLPAVYLEDPVSASFVERLLANPKGFYTEIEGKIRNIGHLFDPRSAPAEALDWLASWLGLTLDPLWQDINQRLQTGTGTKTQDVSDRRRLFIRFATRLFTRRGTADGIRFALHLLLEPCLETTLRRFKLAALKTDLALAEELDRLGLAQPTPTMSDNDIEDLLTQYLLAPMRPSKVRVVERFMTRGGRARVAGDPTEIGSAVDDSIAATAHRFAVLVPDTLSTDVRTMVSRIVDLEKPAHTLFEVRRYWDYFRVGEARLGIDTILGEDARFVPMLLGQNALSEGYLAYPPPMNAADRLALDRDRVGAMPPL
jgi:phage tail-like protein